MKIVVCIKEVPDSAALIRVRGRAVDDSAAHIMNPYDEIALAAALELAKGSPGSEVVVLNLGPERARNTILSALARGAHWAVQIRTREIPGPARTARALAAAISAEKGVDLVLCGRESIDHANRQTHFLIGGRLGWPVLNNVSRLKTEDGRFICRVSAGSGREKLYSLPKPAVIGADRDLALPRYPLMKDMMEARGKPFQILELRDLVPDPDPADLEPRELEEHVFARQGIIHQGPPDRFIEELLPLLRPGHGGARG